MTMGECGCTSNESRYTFPGRGDALYLLTLSAGCRNCDSPAGITIEIVEPEHSLYEEYRSGEFTEGKLKFAKWVDTKGVAIITGKLQHEFVRATIHHLVGIDINDFGDAGTIDEAGAETILEEMFDDSTTRPEVVVPAATKRRSNAKKKRR